MLRTTINVCLYFFQFTYMEIYIFCGRKKQILFETSMLLFGKIDKNLKFEKKANKAGNNI